MRKHLLPLAGALALLITPLCHADGASISIGQPGFYGRLDIGGYPPPQLIYSQPVLVQGAPYGGPPMYVYAPPKHVRHWDRYCRQYGACGMPVYFVQERWYREVYAPRYRYDGGRHRHHDDDDDD